MNATERAAREWFGYGSWADAVLSLTMTAYQSRTFTRLRRHPPCGWMRDELGGLTHDRTRPKRCSLRVVWQWTLDRERQRCDSNCLNPVISNGVSNSDSKCSVTYRGKRQPKSTALSRHYEVRSNPRRELFIHHCAGHDRCQPKTCLHYILFHPALRDQTQLAAPDVSPRCFLCWLRKKRDQRYFEC